MVNIFDILLKMYGLLYGDTGKRLTPLCRQHVSYVIPEVNGFVMPSTSTRHMTRAEREAAFNLREQRRSSNQVTQGVSCTDNPIAAVVQNVPPGAPIRDGASSSGNDPSTSAV